MTFACKTQSLINFLKEHIKNKALHFSQSKLSSFKPNLS